ncbi:hypothetical protein [Nocardioides sp. 1609]|uniref:hypothetical protein n=1 Tax=Nocardioides sp. 1609 TaxID=2508327 RepID=UPI00106FE775|nr:hypothetical protein [Nocardioides sp. 1609]
MSDQPALLTIATRHRGPASSGNGGWTAGALAAFLSPGPAHVVLRTPPPLEVPLDVVRDDDGAVTASRGDVLVGRAAPAAEAPGPVEPVDAATARDAETRYSGLTSHPFPSCFSCGTDRAPGDGLRIFPGRVAEDAGGRVRVAATWTPGTDVDLPTTWAALDCVGGWAGDLEERLMVLGSMSADVLDLPRAGEAHVVVGGARGTDGRKTFTASSLYAGDGRLLATAAHVWFAVDPKDFA